MGVFTKFETFFTGKLSSLLAKYIAIFSSKVILLFQLGIPILVLYYGYSIMTPRGSSATIQEMIYNLVRIGIVFAFVENSNGLLDLSIGFIHELKSGFIGAKSIFSILDEQLLVTQELSQIIYKLDTDYIKFREFSASAMVWLGAILVLASSSIVFIAAEIGLALLTATSPIFIGCLTYGFTRELFNGWLRSIFSCIITLIFATLVVEIGIDISNEIINDLASSPSEEGLMTTGAIALLTGIIASSLVFVSTRMANNIAGVAATLAIQGGILLGAKAGLDTAAATPKFALNTSQAVYGIGKKIGKGIMSKLSNPKAAAKGENDSGKLDQQSQESSFKEVQKTNSQV